MMKKYLRVVVVPILFSSPLVMATHYLGHFGKGTDPTPAEITAFCVKYEQDPAAMANYQAEYDQYCQKKPSGSIKKPKLTTSRITGIKLPQCLKLNSDIVVIGDKLNDQSMQCGFKPHLPVVRRSRGTEKSQIFRITGTPRPDQAYRFTCRIGAQRKSSDSSKGCAQGTIVQPGVKTPDLQQADPVDLIAEIRPAVPQPGQVQTIEVSVHNRGQSQSQRQRYQLLLALVDRDLSRTVDRLSSAFSPGSRNVLLQQRQWIMRIPAGGRSERVAMLMNIPAQLPDIETLYWCAYVDSERTIAEANEGNNLNCVPASSGQQTIRRDDLSGQFGATIRDQKLQPQFDPGQGEGDRSGQRQAVDMDLPLTINGSPFRADIPMDGSTNAAIRWTFPWSSNIATIFLRIKRGAITPGDPRCPAAGTSLSDGNSLMNGWDSPRDNRLPGRGLPAGINLILMPGGVHDLDRYEAGYGYSVVACGLRRNAGGSALEFALASNVVMMYLASEDTGLRPDRDFSGALPFPLPEGDYDFRRPRPANATCSPAVYMWFVPASSGNVYIFDDEFSVHYSVVCATSVNVGEIRYITPAPAGGGFSDGGGGSTYYADAAAAGVLTGSTAINYTTSLSRVGAYAWEISASNNLNPSSSPASARAEWRIVPRPREPFVLRMREAEAARGSRLERHGICFRAAGGVPWPADLATSRSVLIGYRHRYRGVTCERHYTHESRARVPFDLTRCCDSAIERAELTFMIRPPAGVSNTCLGARMTYQIDVLTLWDRPGIITEPGGVGRAIGGYPRPASIPAGPSRGDRVTVDVTAQVNAWVDGYPRRGFEIAPVMGRPTIGTDSDCFVEAFNFELIMDVP